ncbi:type IV pilus modification protein PilV [Kingella potus]|nr:type IV pilus modification protein PilV [Kingella potus]UOP01156.1 type IV pilus modification protein PilV [Kingella potus]
MKKYAQSGFALIEVLVSVVVLVLGILALLATQLRSVSSVRNAETQTIAAQAAQNLIEGMLANPQLQFDAKKITERRYDHYETRTMGNVTSNPAPGSDGYDLDTLARKQVYDFKMELNNRLGDMNVRSVICKDSDLEAHKPIIDNNGNFYDNCDNMGDVAIKIAWLVQGDTDNPQSVSFQTYVRNK